MPGETSAIMERVRSYVLRQKRDAKVAAVLVCVRVDLPPVIAELDELPAHLQNGSLPLAAVFLTPIVGSEVWSVRIETAGWRRPASARSLAEPEVFLEAVKEHYRLPLVLEHPAPTVN